MGEFHAVFLKLIWMGWGEREAWEITVFCRYEMMELKNISLSEE